MKCSAAGARRPHIFATFAGSLSPPVPVHASPPPAAPSTLLTSLKMELHYLHFQSKAGNKEVQISLQTLLQQLGAVQQARMLSLFTWPVLERVSGYNNFLNSSSFANKYIHTKVSDYDFLNIFDKVKLVNLIQTRYCVLTNFPFSLHNPKLSYLLRTLYNCYSLYQLINFI